MHGHPDTLAVVLAGGLSRRMGGGDKGLRRLGDETILARVVERLRPQCAALILNANGDPARFAPLGLVQVPDTVPGFLGPLAGVLAACEWAAENRPGIGWVASAAADTPFLPEDFVARLHDACRAADALLVSAASGGRVHPVNGLWAVSLRDDLRHALVVEGERKVGRWTAGRGAVLAEWPAGGIDPFFNVNEPPDLDEARRLVISAEARDAPAPPRTGPRPKRLAGARKKT